MHHMDYPFEIILLALAYTSHLSVILTQADSID